MIVSAGPVGRVLFTTKPAIVSTVIEKCDAARDFGMIGRYGLPSVADLPWIRTMVGSRELFFLGDMDPVDLMVFAWLRQFASQADYTSRRQRRVSKNAQRLVD